MKAIRFRSVPIVSQQTSGQLVTTRFDLADARRHEAVVETGVFHWWRLTSAGFGALLGLLVALVILAVGANKRTRASDVAAVVTVLAGFGLFAGAAAADVETAEMRRTALRDREGTATIGRVLYFSAFAVTFAVVKEEDLAKFEASLRSGR